MMKSLSASSILLASALLSAAPSAAVSAISFSVDTATCDGDPFANLDLDVTCSGSSTCGFGDTATVSGTVEAVSAFGNSNVVIKACILTDTYCPEKYKRNAGTLCDDWLAPTSGQACGETGMYSISASETIPEADVSNALSWLVTVKIGMEDECEVEAEAEADSSYQMSYSTVGLAALALGGAALASRRRRRLGRDGEDERARGLLEMADSAAAVV